MKKRFATILAILCTLSLTGCTFFPKATEEVKDVISEVAQINQVDVLSQLTKNELLTFTWEETRDYFELNIPNYRDVFLIESDKELTEDDWIALRNVLSVSLFKSAEPDVDETEGIDSSKLQEDQISEIIGNNYEGVSEDTKQELKDYDTYAGITSSEIIDMSMEEFQVFMKGYYVWVGGTSEEYEKSLATLEPEQWEQVKEEFAKILLEAATELEKEIELEKETSLESITE